MVETIQHALVSTLGPALSLTKARVATAGRDNTARVWDLGTGEEEARAPFDAQIVAVSLSGDGSMLAVGAYTGAGMSIEARQSLDAKRTQNIWVVDGWDREHPPSSMNSSTWVFRVHRPDRFEFRHGQPVVSVGLSSKGNMLVTASGRSATQAAAADHAPQPAPRLPLESHLRVWDVRSGRELANAVLPDVTTSTAIAPDETTVAAVGKEGTLRVWTLPRALGSAGQALALGQPTRVLDTGARDGGVLFSADSSRIGIVGKGGGVFDPRAATAMFRAGPEQTTVGFDAAMTRALVEEISPDRLSLRSSLLDTGTGRVVHQVDSLHGNGRSMASDGRLAAAVRRSGGGAAVTAPYGFDVSEIVTAKRAISLEGAHNKEITAMRFTADGTHLATASFDASARIWDTATGAEVARWADAGIVNAVAFSADGRILAVGTEAGRGAVYF